MFSLKVACILVLFNALHCQACSPNVTSDTDTHYSFNVLVNGAQTAFGSGYRAVARVNGATINNGFLRPNVTGSLQDVNVTMKIVDFSCNVILADFTVVNSGTNGATIGICVHADSWASPPDPAWVAIGDMRGLHMETEPFYIQGEEPFSGIYAGSWSGAETNCSRIGVDVSQPSGNDNGIAVNWNGVLVTAGSTREFRIIFSNFLLEGDSGSCLEQGSQCSVCPTANFCYGKSDECYWNGELCLNSSDSPGQCSSTCSACLSASNCNAIGNGCEWHAASHTCVHSSHCIASGSSCGACGSAEECYNKNEYCYWSSNLCLNSSVTSSCNGDDCLSCLSEIECVNHACTWSFGNHACETFSCEKYTTYATCPTSGSTSCNYYYPLDNRCSWNSSVCIDNGCSHFIDGTQQDCMYGESSCTGQFRPNCHWNSVLGICVYTGGNTNCMSLTTHCSVCPTQTLCAAKDPSCAWENGVCVNTSTNPSCDSSSPCTDCASIYECANVGTDCEWYSGNSSCIHSEHCSAANSDCSTCGSSTDCYDKSGLCYWNVNVCVNISTSPTCSASSACVACQSQSECVGKGCVWDYTSRTCGILHCEQYETSAACPTTGTSRCGINNYCSWNASACLDNGCSHDTDCLYTQDWCNRTNCGWNSVLRVCVYIGGNLNCMSTSTSCGVCSNSILCNAKDPRCYWTGNECSNTTQNPTCNPSQSCSSCLTQYDCTHVFGDCEWLNATDIAPATCMHNSHCLTSAGNCSGCITVSDCYNKDAYCYYTTSGICLNSSVNPSCNSSSACSACLSEDDCVNVGPGCSFNRTSLTCFRRNCEQYTTVEGCPTTGSASCYSSDNYCSWNSSVCIDNGCSHSVEGVVQDCMYGQYTCGSYHSDCGWNAILEICVYIGGNANCMSSSTSCGACTSQRLCHAKGESCYWSGNSCLNSTVTNTCSTSSGCSSCLSSFDCLARGPGCAWERESYSCVSSTCENSSSSCGACNAADTCWAKGARCYWDPANSKCKNSSAENTCPSGQPCSECKSSYDCGTLRILECGWDNSAKNCFAKTCDSSSSGCSTCSNTNADTCFAKSDICYYVDETGACLNSSSTPSCNSSTACSACASSSDCSSSGCIWDPTSRSCSSLNCEQFSTSETCPTSGLQYCSVTNRCSWNSSACFDNGCIHNQDCMWGESYCGGPSNPDCTWNSVLETCVYSGGNTNCMSSSTPCSVCANSILCYAKSPVCYWVSNGSCLNSTQSGQSCTLTSDCGDCISSYDCVNLGNDCDWHEVSHSCVHSSHCLSSSASCSACSELGAATCHAKDPYCFHEGANCLNSSSNATCSTSVACSTCLSEHDCRNRGNACSWNAETRTCGAWNCEQFTTQASCPTTGSVSCGVINRCSWNSSVCIDNGCIHNQDCMYGQSSCGSQTANVDCQWNSILGVCVYAGGYQNCMSQYTPCSACTSQRLCHSKNETCYWDAQAGNAGECKNSSSSTTCPNPDSSGCPSCLSKSDCDSHASSECEWHAEIYTCFHQLHCDSPSSSCSSCNTSAAACYQKNQYCFWSENQCFNSSSNDTCNALSNCTSCSSSYDCLNRGPGCLWNDTSATCSELNCEQYTEQSSCPTTGSSYCGVTNRCSWNSSVCVDNGCSHNQDCMYGEYSCGTQSANVDCQWNSYLQICVYTGVGYHCLSTATGCSSCFGERLCYAKHPSCYWSGNQCLNSSAGVSTCAANSCVGCLSAYDCLVRGPGCSWDAESHVCSSASCSDSNSSCASCSTSSADCWSKSSECYWTVNSCQNSSNDNTCPQPSSCSSCKSVYDCQTRRGTDCVWSDDSKTCDTRACNDGWAGCGTCSSGMLGGSLEACYGKNEYCYWNAGTCVNTSTSSTCDYFSSCSECKSSYDCHNRGSLCNWESSSRTCVALNCELYTTQATCPTDGSISCRTSNRCSWNASVCVDNGCGHSSDCMYWESTCNRPGCSWNSILGICLYTGGDSSCMSLTTDCSVCSSERLCHVKSHSCWWDVSTRACRNSSNTPSCASNLNNCSTCQSQSDCLNNENNCGWHGDTFTCIPETHCLNTGSGCNDCDLEWDCYSKNTSCYWTQDYCHNSSVNASCNSSNQCSQCLSQYDCANNLANGCQWDALTRFCTPLNCEQHMNQANCPTTGSISCGSSNYCSWNGSACLDNGCIHNQDCMYGEGSCSNRVSSPDCTWNSELQVCVYSGGNTNCLSSSTQCSVCRDNSVLCYAKSPVCFISLNTGQCINSSASSPTCTNTSSCGSCLSSYDCMVRGPGCSWDVTTHTCSADVCSSDSSSCAACSNQADCISKNTMCYWDVNACRNSSFDNTCPSGTMCSACLSEYDCGTARKADCEWNNETRTCNTLTCSSRQSGCAACTDVFSCHWKGGDCYFNTSSGMCLNSSSSPTCSSGATCSACLSADDCINRGNGCLWNDSGRICEPLNCEQFTDQSSCPTTGTIYCSADNKCSWNSSACVDNGCGHNQDCMYPEVSCNTSTSRPDCRYNSVLGVCLYTGGSTSCMSLATSCSACLSERLCHAKNETCYYNASSGVCVNTTLNPTCSPSQNCSNCLSYSDCMTIKSDCEWHSDSYTCVHERHCLSPTTGCDSCEELSDCFNKNSSCYYQQGTCRNSSDSPSCTSLNSCSSCLSESECSVNSEGCFWNYTSHSCSTWTCEQYDFSSCPTTNTVYCSVDNRCSWNSSACIDNGCIHNQDCMYSEFSCTNSGRPNCTWNSILKVCLYTGGSTNCMALSTSCSACRSETLCFGKNFTCFWDNTSNSCNNSTSSPTCSSSSSCSACRSVYDCENNGLDCEWHSDSHTCVHNTHCLSANANCSECGEASDCYLKSAFCYYNERCYNSSENPSCNSTSECSGCLSANDCSKVGKGCIWETSNNTCIPLNCERFTTRSTCPSTYSSSCSLDNPCSWNSSGVCVDNGCSHDQDCMYANSSCSSRSSSPDCFWNKILDICVYGGGSTSCMSNRTGCSACASEILCSSKGYECEWTDGACINSSTVCSNKNSKCSACSASADECYSKDGQCYYSQGVCVNSSGTCVGICSSCLSQFECLNSGYNCEWDSSLHNCSTIIEFNCSSITFNPSDVCGTECYYQNGTCVKRCGLGFITQNNNPRYCIDASKDSVVDTGKCSGQDCFQYTLTQMERNEQQNTPFHALIVVSNNFSLTSDLNLNYGDVDLVGHTKDNSGFDVGVNQIVFNGQSGGSFVGSNMALNKTVSGSSPIATSLIRASGNIASSGRFVLTDVNVNYIYPRSTASPSVISVENLVFNFTRINIQQSGSASSFHRARVSNDGSIDSCAILTSSSTVYLKSASGEFVQALFSYSDSGALYIDGGNVLFVGVSFVGNVIPGFDAYTNLRHNVGLVNANLNVSGSLGSDVVGGSFITSAPNDQSVITFLSGNVENLLYSPRVENFTIANEDGQIRGKLTGSFTPCSFTVIVRHDGLPAVGLSLPLFVENQTAAYIVLPDNRVSSNGSYTFQFTYKVGTYSGSTVSYTVVASITDSNTEPQPESKAALVVAIVLPIVIVIIAVVVVIVIVVVLKKKEKEKRSKPSEQEMESHENRKQDIFPSLVTTTKSSADASSDGSTVEGQEIEVEVEDIGEMKKEEEVEEEEEEIEEEFI